eukprot:8098567-Alexandrium_andersonii.AAC.1
MTRAATGHRRVFTAYKRRALTDLAVWCAVPKVMAAVPSNHERLRTARVAAPLQVIPLMLSSVHSSKMDGLDVSRVIMGAPCRAHTLQMSSA